MNILEIKNLTKHYGNFCAVNDVSLSVKEGEIFGFIGPNGAGKSTTIRCVMNLLNKDYGKVTICGEEFTKSNNALKKQIGYLPSEIHLYDNITINSLLKYNSSFYDSIDTNKVKLLIKSLEVDTTKKISDLSLGNLKKVGIILALAHSPKLVIMDEATSGLDPLMQESFYNILKNERDNGTAFFFSSHNLSEVKKLCNTVGIIKEGKIRKIDSIDNIVSHAVHFVTVMTDKNQIFEDIADSIISNQNGILKFSYSGPLNMLTKKLSSLDVEKLLIEEPTLEDIFMHYYI